VGAGCWNVRPHQTRREKMVDRARSCSRWGWLAGSHPAIVSGTAKMRPYQFASGIADSLAGRCRCGSAYGWAGFHGHHTGHDFAILVIGLGAGALVTVAACAVTDGARPACSCPRQRAAR